MEKKTNSSLKILAVDDNPQNIKVIGSILREADYSVGFAFNGQQALDLLFRSGDYDLILLDVNMPVMNGYETCRKIRQQSRFDHLPVIFLTALSETENIVNGLEAGAQDYVSKPFNSRELLARVKTHLELKVSREKLARTNEWLEHRVGERTRDLQVANDKLARANAELESLDEAKVDFLKIISHEINTPLNGIIGFTGILKEEMKEDAVVEMIHFLEQSARRLMDFAALSLLITELRTKHKHINPEEVDLKLLNREITDELKSAGQREGKLYCVNYNARSVYADRDLLKKCLIAVLRNSLKFSPLAGSVVLTYTESAEDVSCRIEDEGPGFSERILNLPYQLFTFGSDYRDEDKGLSLALVKLVMDAHQGTVRLSNREHGGACVELVYPKFPGSVKEH